MLFILNGRHEDFVATHLDESEGRIEEETTVRTGVAGRL